LINQVHSAAQFIRSLDQGRDHLRILFQFGLRKCFDIRRSDAYIELHAPVPAAAHPISVEPPRSLGCAPLPAVALRVQKCMVAAT
jgi:hypothetical protein